MKKKRFVFSVDESTKILVIVPHPDDESIGLGGFLKKYKLNCELVLATNGCYGNPEMNWEETIRTRKEEFRNALDSLGITKFSMIDVEDRHLSSNLNRLSTYIRNDYDYIFIPYRKDIHPDHRCIYKFVKRLIKFRKIKAHIVEYEVWTPLQNPNLFIDISDCYEEKELAIRKYPSQIKHCQYDWGSLGLNRYRGMLSGNKYAEAFFVNKTVCERFLDALKDFKDKIK